MREFMDYIQAAFYSTTGWSRENSYSSLNATSDALLHFPLPRGLRLTLSSLATPYFATTYQLGTVGVVDGSISYLYSTVPLDHNVVPQSEKVSLPELLRSYRPLAELSQRGQVWTGAWTGDESHKNALAYGRLYLPMSMLEALMVRRLSPTLQMQIGAVSDQTLRNGGTVLGMLQYDEGKYGLEGLISTDGGLLGIRGLYNFGGDTESVSITPPGASENANGSPDRIHGRFSAGAELYYGTLNKSGGMSLGARFATLPTHKGTPLTATMTINPLMGSVSWTYAVQAGGHCSIATKYDFNVYSYESDWAVGMELWRKKGAWAVHPDEDQTLAATSHRPERSFQAKMEWRLDEPLPGTSPPDALVKSEPKTEAEPEKKSRSFQAKMEWRRDGETEDGKEARSGVLKARLDQHWRIGLLWEGRVKSLLFSLGSGIDLRRPDSPFRNVGLEVQFSS
ncbi:hypothetical protein F5Y15DRAFT_407806 [Xylariaceae sp. FL0016]|nr:hypothetical protein F5Y15DRAFT_407806 [Xylariaceae sp. FL0016]